MSARKQAGVLKSIIYQKLRDAGVNYDMVQALRRNKNVYTGTLVETIQKRNLFRLTSIRYTINKELDVIENVTVTFNNNIADPYYAKFIDPFAAEETFDTPEATVSGISKWIYKKIQNGTWENPYGTKYVVNNNYSNRNDFKVKEKGSRGGTSKIYEYDLVGSPKSKKYRNALAYLISRKINNDGYLENQTPFLATGNFSAEVALEVALEEFRELYLNDIAESVETIIVNLFE